MNCLWIYGIINYKANKIKNETIKANKDTASANENPNIAIPNNWGLNDGFLATPKINPWNTNPAPYWSFLPKAIVDNPAPINFSAINW